MRKSPKSFTDPCTASFFRFTISLAYYGVSLNIADLSGNRFFNFMLGGALELVAFLLTYVSLRVVGRRACLVSYLFLSGALLIGTVAAEKLLHSEWGGWEPGRRGEASRKGYRLKPEGYQGVVWM